jgi:hypothetical protein
VLATPYLPQIQPWASATTTVAWRSRTACPEPVEGSKAPSLTAEERQQRRLVIFDLWLAGGTERETANQLAITHQQVHKVLALATENTDITVTEEQPPIYNVWNFGNRDPRFGQKHPGQIPGQALVNLLLWLTEPYDLVVDPMAGGGTTVDVCKYLQKRYYCGDIDPRRSDIRQWDIRQGYPRLPRKPKLIFLDPPYWRLKRAEYSTSGSAMGSYQVWLVFIAKLSTDSARTVAPGGYIALMIESFLDEKETNEFLFLTQDCLNLFKRVGLKGIQEISVNMPTQIKSFRDVEYARRKHILLDLKRELVVFQRRSYAQTEDGSGSTYQAKGVKN